MTIDVEKNWEKFKELFTKLIIPNIEGSDQLLTWIEGTDMKIAPASSMYHLAVKGGLVQHSLNVFDRLVSLAKAEYNEDYETALDTTMAELALIALCHDLCKCNTYKPVVRNKKVYSDKGTKKDELGKFEWVSEWGYEAKPVFTFGHGSKSLMIVQDFCKGLPLSCLSAIRFHMGGLEYMNGVVEPGMTGVYNDFPLVVLTHTADLLATYIDENIADV